MLRGLVKASFRVNTVSGTAGSLRNTIGKRDFTRNLWHMSKISEGNDLSAAFITIHKPSFGCNCGCGSKFIHTKGERELVEFLTEEIVAERKAQKSTAIPTEVDGFKIKLDGAEVELVKQSDKEKIVVTFNVNHTVDADDEGDEVDPSASADKSNLAEMKSKPQFEVDIVKGDKTVSFTCSFLNDTSSEEGDYSDVFGIDEMTIYQGEWNEKVYAVAGDVLDGYLYDLLMNLLEEKGIGNEFVEKLSELSTTYEHSSYIGLLESLSKFTTTGK